MKTVKKVNPDLLDVVLKDARPVLFYEGNPLETLSGVEVSHPSLRLIDHIARELSLTKQLAIGGINSYTLFCLQKDFLENGRDDLSAHFEELFLQDPNVARHKSGNRKPEVSTAPELLDFLDEHGQVYSFIMGGVFNIIKNINQFLIEYTKGEANISQQGLKGQAPTFFHLYNAFPLPEKAAVTALFNVHRCGLVLPLLLISKVITPSEYATGAFIAHLPLGGQGTGPLGPADSEDGTIPWKEELPDWNSPLESFNHLRNQAGSILEFLTYFNENEGKRVCVQESIRKGEDFDLEFKSTLRWNLKADKKDDRIEHACLKTITAFLNTSGGRLLVGVRDDGSIEGIESDGFPNEDKFAQHFWNLIKSSLGVDMSAYLETCFEPFEGRTVFVIDCGKSPKPIFLNQKNFGEEFYIRVGPSSARLGIKEALSYIEQRFRDEASA